MTEQETPEAAILLEHLERDLGPFSGHGVLRSDWDAGFSALQFHDRPDAGITATVTFGVSNHLLEGADGQRRRQELLVTLRSACADAALDIAANVGDYLLERHVAVLAGESIAMPPQGDSALDALVAAKPEPFAARLALCDGIDGGVEIVWLLPCSRAELHVAVEHGVADLLSSIRERGGDPYDLGRRPVPE